MDDLTFDKLEKARREQELLSENLTRVRKTIKNLQRTTLNELKKFEKNGQRVIGELMLEQALDSENYDAIGVAFEKCNSDTLNNHDLKSVMVYLTGFMNPSKDVKNGDADITEQHDGAIKSDSGGTNENKFDSSPSRNETYGTEYHPEVADLGRDVSYEPDAQSVNDAPTSDIVSDERGGDNTGSNILADGAVTTSEGHFGDDGEIETELKQV